MQVFRECLYEEIVATLQICVGAPSAEATAYRRAMLACFGNSLSAVSRAMALVLPNGDWRREDRVEFYPPTSLRAELVSKRKYRWCSPRPL